MAWNKSRIRNLILICFVSLAIFGLAQAKALAAGDSYLGEDRTTQGSWIGVYGQDGYILPFFAATSASGRDVVAPSDVTSLPEYIESYSRGYGATYWVSGNPSSEMRALQTPDGTTRKAVRVYGARGDLGRGWTFQVTPGHEFLFTVYASDYTSSEQTNAKIELKDANNQLLHTINSFTDIHNGVYLQYRITGSFRLDPSTNITPGNTFQNAFFFDSLPELRVSGLEVQNEATRKAKLTWTTSDVSKQIQILRKGPGEGEYSVVAVRSGAETTYTDSNLQAGGTYNYRLRTVDNRKYSDSTVEQSIVIPIYRTTMLAFSTTSYTASQPGETVALQATLTDAQGTGLADKEVRFELQGAHVGTYIPSSIGTVVTGANGVAEASFSPAYAGSYQVKAVFAADDTGLWDSSEATVPLAVLAPVWNVPPVLLQFSDAVKPDGLIRLNGEGLFADLLEVRAQLADGSGSPSPESGISLEVIQTDPQGQFAVAKLPANAIPGVYNIWVGNAYGWSQKYLLNAPRLHFISDDEAAPGGSIQLIGRNMAGTEFGAANSTKVRLIGGSSYEAAATDINPFAVTFTIPETIPVGVYDVEASNDGGIHWSVLDSGQQLHVGAPSSDPLGLGVAWANLFNWNDQFDVTDYGAIPNDQGDDTLAVQSAIQAAKTSQGGVIYFPNGSYRISKISLPADIVLVGESQTGTKLVYTGTGGNFIETSDDGKTEGRQGVSRLTLLVDEAAKVLPDAFFWLGMDWTGSYDKELRTADHFFITHVTLDYTLDKTGYTGGRGLGVVCVFDQKWLFEGNSFKGWAATLSSLYYNGYSQIRNNTLEYSNGYGGMNFHTYNIFENNTVIGHPEFGQDLHGYFGDGQSYVYNNSISHVGTLSHNDGETVSNDIANSFFNYGTVLKGEADMIETAPVKEDLTIPTIRQKELAVVITGGRGLGQYRLVQSITDNRIYVKKPWDIVPDGTSSFTLLFLNKDITYYKNTALDGTKGMWFYGSTMDSVMADNTSTDAEGMAVFGHYNPADWRLAPSYFIRIENNLIEGVSRKSGHAGVGSSSSGNFAVTLYGLEIRNNTIIGDLAAVPQKLTESPALSGIFSGVYSPGGEYPARNMIIDNNHLQDLTNGITIETGTRGVVLRDNTFENVSNEIKLSGNASDSIIMY